MASPRKASAINPFLILDGLLRYLLDQQGFCMSDSSYAEREAEGINESGFHQHGMWMNCLGCCPLDFFNITALLVKLAALLWCIW